jgi:hypothetical protein
VAKLFHLFRRPAPSARRPTRVFLLAGREDLRFPVRNWWATCAVKVRDLFSELPGPAVGFSSRKFCSLGEDSFAPGFVYGDQREIGGCIHCGGPADTLDHVPSKLFLDDPLPANVDGCAACFACNNSLGSDEEYLACILECAATGQADPDLVERRKVANILRNSPALVGRLKRTKTETDAGLVWAIEENRVKRVLVKLARGHATLNSTPREWRSRTCIGLALLSP